MAALINIWNAQLKKFEANVPALPKKNDPNYETIKTIQTQIKSLKSGLDKYASAIKAFDKTPDSKKYNELIDHTNKITATLRLLAERHKGATDDIQIFRQALKALAAAGAEIQAKSLGVLKDTKVQNPLTDLLAATNITTRLFGTISASKASIANIKTKTANVEKALAALRAEFNDRIGGNGAGRELEAQLVAYRTDDTDGTDYQNAYARAHKWNTYELPQKCGSETIQQKLQEFAQDLAIITAFQAQMAKKLIALGKR